MNKKFLICAVSLFFGMSAVANANEVVIYSLFDSEQYTVYDKETCHVISQCAYEPRYVYEHDVYEVIVPMDLNNTVINEDTQFMGISFSASDVDIVETESGKKLIPGTMK